MNLRVDYRLSGAMPEVVANLDRTLDWIRGAPGTVANACAHWHAGELGFLQSAEMDSECLSQSSPLKWDRVQCMLASYPHLFDSEPILRMVLWSSLIQ